MKTLPQALTVLLAVLLITGLPRGTADDCCTPEPCCPVGECQCHLSAATPSSPPPETPATLPVLTDAIAPVETPLLNVVPPAAAHRNLTAVAATFTAAPLYALTHAFLI